MMRAFVEGLALSGGLIIALGAQNAFVLRQGLLRRRVFATAATCFACDAGLILLGVGGMGLLLAERPTLGRAVALGGAAFLLVYGLLALRRSILDRSGSLSVEVDAEGRSGVAAGLRNTVLAALGFSLLNPHVYLDTVVVLGGIGAQLPIPERGLFAAGAVTASGLWFFGLGYGATMLAPLFRRPGAWRLLDAGIGILMLVIAGALARGTLWA